MKYRLFLFEPGLTAFLSYLSNFFPYDFTICYICALNPQTQKMKKINLLLTLILSVCTISSFAKGEPAEEIQEVDNSIIIDRISNDDVDIIVPSFIFSFSEAEIKIKFHNPEHTKLLLNKNKVEVIVNGESKLLEFVNGEASFKHKFDKSKTLSIYVEDLSFSKNVTVYPLWAILIPLIVIILYILKRLISKK
jgi:hypothetical protein